jgi:hypothetical protein
MEVSVLGDAPAAPASVWPGAPPAPVLPAVSVPVVDPAATAVLGPVEPVLTPVDEPVVPETLPVVPVAVSDEPVLLPVDVLEEVALVSAPVDVLPVAPTLEAPAAPEVPSEVVFPLQAIAMQYPTIHAAAPADRSALRMREGYHRMVVALLATIQRIDFRGRRLLGGGRDFDDRHLRRCRARGDDGSGRFGFRF